MCSPSLFGKPSGNTWSKKRKREIIRAQKRENEVSSEPIETLLGPIVPSWRLLGPSWTPLGGLLGRSLPLRIRLCGRTLWPELGHAIGLRVPPAVVGTLRGTRGGRRRRRRRGRIRKKEEEEEKQEEASWGTLGASWDLPGGLLEASWGPPSASWGPLGASWAPLWPS